MKDIDKKIIKNTNYKQFHLNDSYGELGSHLNRHAPLSKGHIFKNYEDNLSEIIKVSNKYKDINEKYLIKLGSYGLFNRLNILKNINNPLD